MPKVYENLNVYLNIADIYEDLCSINELPMMRPSSNSSLNSREDTSSPRSIDSQLMHLEEEYMTIDDITEQYDAYLTILEQPIDKFRFRYKSEMMGTHGSLVGTNNMTNRKKSAPSVQLHNYFKEAIIRCTLVTSNDGHRIPHAHRLIRKDGITDQDDPHHIKISEDDNFIATFHGMGIIHTAKKNIKEELIRKMKIETMERLKRTNINAVLSIREEAQIKVDAETYQKCMNLNSVALCFQAFVMDINQIMIPITQPVYSHIINNLKSALTGELKICRIDKIASCCEGGEEIFILVEKVGKKNIKVKFFELNDDDEEIWRDYGRFSELDVHHQYAIVFKTPPYKDLNITSAKEIFIQLERPSDAEYSEPLKFTYKPSNRYPSKKRARTTYLDENSEITYMKSPLDSETDIGEIQRLLNEGIGGDVTEEFQGFCSGLNIPEYTHYLESSEEQRSACVADGPSKKDDINFAKNFISKFTKALTITEEKKKKQKLNSLLDDRYKFGDSPLHAALRYGYYDIVKSILLLFTIDQDYEKLVNIQNSSGKTPLHFAVIKNQPEIVAGLLRLGADPNMCDEHGSSPLHDGVKCDLNKCVNVLLSEKSVRIEEYNDAGWNPLQLAAEAGSYRAVESLVNAGADVNSTDMSYGRTALYIAVEGSHKNIVEFFLTKTNVDVNKRNFSGNTALHSAVVISGNRAQELCRLLKDHGADPNMPNCDREYNHNIDNEDHNDDIKREVNSDTEDLIGRTSIDLASERPEILQLLNNPDHELNIESLVKQEMRDGDDEDSVKIKQNENVNIFLNGKQRLKLAVYLDKKNQDGKIGWEKLVMHLQLDFLLDTLRKSITSPSLLLLNYISEHQNLSLTKLCELLQEIDEQEAVKYLTEILSQSP